ncbi:MAG: phage tail protein [Tannerella sp.]|jgi:phage tail-like protein|nr:phage tail protein [Tannerella sp.]
MAVEKQDNVWSPLKFYYTVKMDTDLAGATFQAVSGLKAREHDAIIEGGLNTYQHRLPKETRHDNLLLKGAKLPKDSSLVAWIKETLEEDFEKSVQLKTLTVELLNEKGTPVCTWICRQAYPARWEVGAPDADKNSVLIETLEISYATIQRL